jgi:hypothetical protein
VPHKLQKEDFQKAYSILDASPLEFDCGILCDSFCCKEFEPGVGIYLLPGEEQMFTQEETWLTWMYPKARYSGFPSSWKGRLAFVMCNGQCPREKRPIQCRTFPLMPYLNPDKELETRLDLLSGILICPVLRNPEKFALNPQFTQAVERGWSLLLKDPLIWDVVWQRSRELDEQTDSPWLKLFQQ